MMTPPKKPSKERENQREAAIIILFTVTEKQREDVMKQSAGELRLQRDITITKLNVPKSCSIRFPNAKFDPLNFEVSIIPDDGYYLGCTILFSFQVSPIYPHEAPKVKCKTKVNHPKIDLEGNVCLNILKVDWKAVLDINNVIYGLHNLLKEPIHEDPLNHDVFTDNTEAFESNVRAQSLNLHMGSLEKLPQELFSSILSMLPARELIKCKCVCKSWFDLITNPHFVTNYYVLHNNRNCYKRPEERLLVLRTNSLSYPEACVSILSLNVNEFERLFFVNALYSSDEYEFQRIQALHSFDKYKFQHIYWSEIMGPCNGLYFLKGRPNVIINPSLRQFKCLRGGFNESYSLRDYVGFGFDPITNDYKVIVLKYRLLKETNERKVAAELYSLNYNSWRKLDDVVLPLSFQIGDSSEVYTYVNNCFHWWGYVDESSKKDDIVLSFDMVTELFRKIKVPKIRSSSYEYFITLAPFNDSTTIGAIVYPWRGTEKFFDIWVMKDYWNEGSWIKQYSVGPVQGLCKFVGFIGNNQVVWKDNSHRLVLYELDNECAGGLPISVVRDSVRAARYTESLVSLHRGNEK